MRRRWGHKRSGGVADGDGVPVDAKRCGRCLRLQRGRDDGVCGWDRLWRVVRWARVHVFCVECVAFPIYGRRLRDVRSGRNRNGRSRSCRRAVECRPRRDGKVGWIGRTWGFGAFEKKEGRGLPRECLCLWLWLECGK